MKINFRNNLHLIFQQSVASLHIHTNKLKEEDDVENDYRLLGEGEREDEHVYHVLEERQDDVYEELDKYEKNREKEDNNSVQHEGLMDEGEGPWGGASVSGILTLEGHETSELIPADQH